MTDTAYNRLPGRLAIIATAVVTLQFLVLLAWQLSLSPQAEHLREVYRQAPTAFSILMNLASTLALTSLIVYARIQGHLERHGSAGLAAPRKFMGIFALSVLLVGIAAQLLWQMLTAAYFNYMFTAFPNDSMHERMLHLSLGQQALGLLHNIIWALVAVAVALRIGRADTAGPRQESPVLPFGSPLHAPPDAPARAAVTTFTLACLTLQALLNHLAWVLTAILASSQIAWGALGAVAAPLIPAALGYIAARPLLRQALHQARPARAVLAAISAFLALQVLQVLVGLGWIWMNRHSFLSVREWVLFILVLLVLYLLAFIPVCRGFLHLFYRNASRAGLSDAPRPAGEQA